MVYENTKRTEQAERGYQQCVAVCQDLVRDHPAVPRYRNALAYGFNNLGNLYSNTDRPSDEEKAFQEALALWKALARDYPEFLEYTWSLAAVQCSLGNLRWRRGEHAGALPWFNDSITGLQALLVKQPRQGSARRFLTNASYGRALALSGLGRHAEAMPDWDRA